MKVKLSDLNANPFKEKLGSGLDEETIKKLQSNLDELGMMGALPIVQIGKKYHMVYGHHRVEALKRTFGKDYQIEVEMHKYNEDQLLRGMVIENLTQRNNEFKQEEENYIVVQDYLMDRKIFVDNKRKIIPLSGNISKTKPFEFGTPSQLSLWLDKGTGTVAKKTKIYDYINIHKNLAPELKKNIKKQSHAPGEKDEDDETIGVKVATALASFKDKQEQKDLAKAIKQSREQHGNKVTKNITIYKSAPDEIKKQVRQLTLDIADVQDEIEKQEMHDVAEARPKTVFIANFNERMRQFDKNVRTLEKQVKLFSKVFHSNDFKDRYNVLKPKQKEKLNFVIFNIRERMQKCQDEIEFFMKQLPDTVILLEAK